MEVENDRYECADDLGNDYVVIEYQQLIRIALLSGSVKTITGLKRYALTDGRHVNYIDASTFKIVATDTLIHRI